MNSASTLSADDLREHLRAALRGRLARSPLDFIRRMDPAGDRERWLLELTGNVAPEGDLNALVDLPGVGRTAVFAQVLPWDTAFFGFKVARLSAVLPLDNPSYQVLTDLGGAVRHLLESCRDLGVRYVFAPVDARDAGLARALSAHGFAFIESRLYSHCDLDEFSPAERHDVRLADRDDIEALAEVAASTVNAYDRFHADPILVGDAADRLMREWVAASISKGFADATMVPNVARPGAFLTIKYHREHWQQWGLPIGQAPFGAVAAEFRGWYVKLISEICIHLRAIGARHFYMVSQATNNAVVRCWEKLGLSYGKNELVFRALL